MIHVNKKPVKRLPQNAIDFGGLIGKNKPRVPTLNGIEHQLRWFHDYHRLNMSNIQLLYNDYAIVVMANHPESWSERHHEKLCSMFPVILYAVEKNEVIHARNVSTTVIYQYINKFLKDKWNEINEVKWNQIFNMGVCE